jgi:hypothetical protein
MNEGAPDPEPSRYPDLDRFEVNQDIFHGVFSDIPAFSDDQCDRLPTCRTLSWPGEPGGAS